MFRRCIGCLDHKFGVGTAGQLECHADVKSGGVSVPTLSGISVAGTTRLDPKGPSGNNRFIRCEAPASRLVMVREGGPSTPYPAGSIVRRRWRATGHAREGFARHDGGAVPASLRMKRLFPDGP